MNFNVTNHGLGELLPILMIAMSIAMAAVHIVFAGGVYQAAVHLVDTRGVYFASPFIWALATLMGGVFVATAFWVIHLSALSTTMFSVERNTV